MPVLQVYAPGGTAGAYGGDVDTWFAKPDANNSFSLQVIGAFDPNTVALENLTLVVSLPYKQVGTLTVEANQTLYYPYQTGASLDILTNIINNDAFDHKADFLPADMPSNNHYPFQDGVSEFVVYQTDLAFCKSGCVSDYDADSGKITPSNTLGSSFNFNITLSGFSWAHFDAYAYQTDQCGKKKLVNSWEIAPASHDATALSIPSVPLPATVWEGGLGLALLACIRLVRSARSNREGA